MVLLAVIGAPHGVKGEVRVKPHTEDPLGFCDYGPLQDADGRSFEVLQARMQKNMAIVKFDGVTTREAAEALNGVELFVDRALLPEPEDEDEFYLTDLIGLEAVLEDGTVFGKVSAVHDFGAGDIIEVKPVKGPAQMYSFTRAIFPEIDLAAGRMTIVPPPETSEREGEEFPSVAGQDEAEGQGASLGPNGGPNGPAEKEQ